MLALHKIHPFRISKIPVADKFTINVMEKSCHLLIIIWTKIKKEVYIKIKKRLQ